MEYSKIQQWKNEGYTVLENLLDKELLDNSHGCMSNLYKNGKLLSSSELTTLQKNNEDLSLLNPASSAFWTNNKVEEFDASKQGILPRNRHLPLVQYCNYVVSKRF